MARTPNQPGTSDQRGTAQAHPAAAKTLAGLAAGVLLGTVLAACSAGPPPQRHPPPPRHPVAATQSPAASLGNAPHNVSLAAQAASLPAGPFRITVEHCGKLTRAQRNKFGTTARGGLTYRYANVSRSLAGSPSLAVNFLAGHGLAGSNVTGNQEAVGPGQSAEGEVDAVGLSGQPITFTACQLTGYNVVTAAGDSPGTYRPVSP